MHVFIGYAIEVDGKKCIILNEPADDESRFCKAYKAEAQISTLATKYPASYHIAIFACKTVTNVLIEEFEEDGSIMVSPKLLDPSRYFEMVPSYSKIRMVGLSKL